MKITIIFFAVFLALTSSGWQVAEGGNSKAALRAGFDLVGGADRIAEVDTNKPADDQKKIAPEVAGEPRSGQTNKPQLAHSNSLEFALLANERLHKEIIRQVQASPDAVLRRNGRVIAAWREVAWNENKAGEVRKQKPIYASPDSETVQREIDRNGQKVRELLVVYESPEKRITGHYLARAFKSMDRQGLPAVELSLNQQGAALLHQFTSKYAPLADGFHHRMAFLIDDQIILGPQVNEPIRGNLVIEGNYTADEVDHLLNSLLGGIPQKQGEGTREAPAVKDTPKK